MHPPDRSGRPYLVIATPYPSRDAVIVCHRHQRIPAMDTHRAPGAHRPRSVERTRVRMPPRPRLTRLTGKIEQCMTPSARRTPRQLGSVPDDGLK